MNWLQLRYSDNGNSTQGLFFQKAEPKHLWMAHTLEDEFREIKVAGETRYDAGLWELKIAKFIETKTSKNHGFKVGDCLIGKTAPFVKSQVPTEFLVDHIVSPDEFILDVLTPLTFKHRQAYNVSPFGIWFKHHIEITGLPRHKGVYVHGGNNEKHTDACLLLGDTQNNHTIEPDRMERSIQAVKRFYDVCYPYLESGKRSYIEVRDEISIK